MPAVLMIAILIIGLIAVPFVIIAGGTGYIEDNVGDIDEIQQAFYEAQMQATDPEGYQRYLDTRAAEQAARDAAAQITSVDIAVIIGVLVAIAVLAFIGFRIFQHQKSLEY